MLLARRAESTNLLIAFALNVEGLKSWGNKTCSKVFIASSIVTFVASSIVIFARLLSRQRNQSSTKSSLGFPSSYFNPFIDLSFQLSRYSVFRSLLAAIVIVGALKRAAGKTSVYIVRGGQRVTTSNHPCAYSCRSSPDGGSYCMCLMPYHFSSTVISVRFSAPSTRRSTKSILPKLSSSIIPALTSPSSIIFPL